MTDQIHAADLPNGSIVSGTRATYVRDHSSQTAPWRGNRGGQHGNCDVDAALADGAEVLRVGDTSSQTMAGARWGNLTVPERAALDAWNRGSADTTGMLYAVRHAVVAERKAAKPALLPDARERLARHLYMEGSPADWRGTAELAWDREDDAINRETWLAHADAILAVVTGGKG